MTIGESQELLEAAHLLYFVSKENQPASNYSKVGTKRLLSDQQQHVTKSLDTQDTQDQDYLPNKLKKKKNRNSKTCTFCFATQTPLWRNGPPEYQILCNRCGVKYQRGRLF